MYTFSQYMPGVQFEFMFVKMCAKQNLFHFQILRQFKCNLCCAIFHTIYGKCRIYVCDSISIVECKFFFCVNRKCVKYTVNIYCQVNPSTELNRWLFLVNYIVSMSSILFVPCYFGSMLSSHSAKISVSCYNCNWLQQTRTFKSTMGIFMLCSEKPIVLYTFQRFFAIELPTFLMV